MSALFSTLLFWNYVIILLILGYSIGMGIYLYRHNETNIGFVQYLKYFWPVGCLLIVFVILTYIQVK